MHLFYPYTKHCWFSLVIQYINAPNIILNIANPLDPDNTNNQVMLMLEYYLYKCRCLGDKSSINGGIKYLKYCSTIEKTTINFLSSTHKEYMRKKLLSFETVLGVWNFSAVLQSAWFYKLNVFCLGKIVYAYHKFFLYFYLPLSSLKINKLQNNSKFLILLIACIPLNLKKRTQKYS